ncbi:MAG TPA: histidine kinase N-terminal 7TM domain-containing protein [Tenuifilaceae bacterium]|nr:histidine kinase N-terminal 7TM domain-containing protein [Tenuifilaceae bacterium]
MMGLNLFILVLVLSSILSFILAFFLWNKRSVLGTPSLAGVLAAIGIWALANGIEYVVPTLSQKMIFVAIRYFGIVQVPVWLFLFTCEYTKHFEDIPGKHKLFLWLIPIASMVFAITNNSHNLFFLDVKLNAYKSISFVQLEHGLWWWIHTFYSYLLILISFFLLVLSTFKSSEQQKHQIYILLASITVPIFSNFVYIIGWRPLSFVDLTPIAFAVTGILFFWGIYSKKLFNLKPIALDTLFANLPDGIIVLDNSNIIIDINHAALEMVSLHTDEVVGKPIDEVFAPYNELFNALDSSSREFQYNRKIYDFLQSPIYGKQNVKVGLLLIFRNVSEKKQTETELKSTRDRFELAVVAAGLDTWENNLVTGERIGGDKIYLELGYKPNEIPRSIDDIFRLVHPDDLKNVKQRINNHVAGKTSMYTADFRIKDKLGNYQWVTNYGKVVERDSEGNTTRFIGLTLNINDRKRIEERTKKQNDELLKANAEKDKFFSIIAHDLRGPFQGFIGLTELMSESIQSMSHDEIQDLSRTLQGTAKNLYELLDNLLNWAVVKRGQKRFNVERVNLSSIVGTIVEIVKHQTHLKQQELKNNIDKDINVYADKETLKTIIRNLVSNAVKFTPHGGKISVTSADRQNGFIEVSVEDTGIGMSATLKDNLFKINQKVSRLGTDDEPSTGLGLILCKELIEKHGGVIWVESVPGKGSNFRFTLPKVE